MAPTCIRRRSPEKCGHELFQCVCKITVRTKTNRDACKTVNIMPILAIKLLNQHTSLFKIL